MSSVRMAHTIWLMRRAAILESLSPDARGEAPDPERAALLRGVD